MPRSKRLDQPGVAQHVIQRGNDRQACFRHRSDYLFYLTELRRAALDSGSELHAYVLMTNHVHLLVTPHEPRAIPLMMQRLGRRFVRHFNDTHQRTGTLWEGRYRACPVENGEYLLHCQRYIDLNPVRARLVEDPLDYPWSSHAALTGNSEDPMLAPHPAYLGLGDTPAQCQARYRVFALSTSPQHELETIRRCIHRQHAYGSDAFRDSLEAAPGQVFGPGQPGRPRKHAGPGRKTPL